ncbi:MAG: DUF2188 domain-containing protein [Candidatus Izemoplasmatales bacterium]
MPAIIEENFTFVVIAIAIIIIFMVAYFTFIRPKRKKSHKKNSQNQGLLSKDDDKELHRETFDKATYLKSSKTKGDDTDQLVPEDKQELETEESSESQSEIEEDQEVPSEEEESEEENQDEEKEAEKDFGKYHVLYREKDKRWYVKREGSEKTLRVLHTKEEAIAWATIKAINQDTNIVIHNKEGKIEKHGY